MSFPSSLFLLRGQWERAAQLLVMGVTLDSVKNHFLESLLFSPFLLFVVLGVYFEILHYLHRRNTASARATWNHIQKIKGERDLTVLIKLLFEKQRLWGLAQMQDAMSKTDDSTK